MFASAFMVGTTRVLRSKCSFYEGNAASLVFTLSCRRRFWFWDTVVLLQTLALAASQVFATSLDSYFQLTIMLMILVVGAMVMAHYQPFEEPLSQSLKVRNADMFAQTKGNCKECYQSIQHQHCVHICFCWSLQLIMFCAPYYSQSCKPSSFASGYLTASNNIQLL